jgi:hypothetical protein
VLGKVAPPVVQSLIPRFNPGESFIGQSRIIADDCREVLVLYLPLTAAMKPRIDLAGGMQGSFPATDIAPSVHTSEQRPQSRGIRRPILSTLTGGG